MEDTAFERLSLSHWLLLSVIANARLPGSFDEELRGKPVSVEYLSFPLMRASNLNALRVKTDSRERVELHPPAKCELHSSRLSFRHIVLWLDNDLRGSRQGRNLNLSK